VSQVEERVVYALEMGGRGVYCSSPACVQSLLSIGWKLSDPGQLTRLVKELASGSFRVTHAPEDHFR
jgi:hypothetical protein